MATIYPTWIAKYIINKQPDKIKCPNFYEAFGVNYCNSDPIIPSHMICDNYTGAFIAQDVNRCQDYFPNKIQTDQDLSCNTLKELYKSGYRIDWRSMQNIVPPSIFVGDKYWKLIK